MKTENNYYMINITTGEKFMLVNATKPAVKIQTKNIKGGKKKLTNKQKWMPIKYDYASLVTE